MLKSLCATAMIVVSVSSGPLGAQVVELGPSFGWYQPLGKFRAGPVESTDLPQSASDLRGLAWGADARFLFHKHAGIEGIFATAASTVPGCECPGGFLLPSTGERVSLAAVEGLYRIHIGDPNEVSLGLGPAVIQHGGEGYSRYGSPRSWGALGGIEVAHGLSSHLEVAASAVATAYSFHLQFPPQSGPQRDLLLSLNLRWRLRAASPNDR